MLQPQDSIEDIGENSFGSDYTNIYIGGSVAGMVVAVFVVILCVIQCKDRLAAAPPAVSPN